MSNTLGKLYIVATPIGNMSDMTFRAVETLKNVDIILCEDTRTTGSLLKHYEIPNKNSEGFSKLISFHSHSKLQKTNHIIELIREGKNLALVSDAGTPCISDPGVMLVAELRKVFNTSSTEKDSEISIQETIEIITIPGPSALISALSISGIPTHEFTFKGFVPHKKGRETFFKELAEIPHTVACYESVHRIVKTLESLHQYIPDRKIFIARELTKVFEQGIEGLPQKMVEYFTNHPDKVRGEFVIIVEPKK
jgi:16S rRNA (cytidine1402-2'-O)-methyltransferase